VRAVVACLGSLVLALVLVLVAAFWFVFALASPLESPGLFVVAPFAVMMGGLAVSSLLSTSVVPAVWATRVRVRRHEEAVAQHTGRAPRLPDSDLEVEWLLTGSRFVGFFFTAVHTGDERGIDPEAARRLPRRPERWLAPVRPFRAPLPSRCSTSCAPAPSGAPGSPCSSRASRRRGCGRSRRGRGACPSDRAAASS